MLAPIELIKATIDGMIGRRFGRIVNITSHAVKAPIGFLGLSNGARAGLTGFVAGLSRSVAEHNVTINNLLPGTFDTDRLKANLEALAKGSGREIGVVTEGDSRRQSDAPLRTARGVRRRLRFPVLGASELHHRPKPADRRRRLSPACFEDSHAANRLRNGNRRRWRQPDRSMAQPAADAGRTGL